MNEEQKEKLALFLWNRLFAWTDDPFTSDDYGRAWCFFCGEGDEMGHEKDCIWVEAQKLMNGPNGDV